MAKSNAIPNMEEQIPEMALRNVLEKTLSKEFTNLIISKWKSECRKLEKEHFPFTIRENL